MHPTESELNEYVDGSLEPSAERTVRQHLEACGQCRVLVRDLRELVQTARTLDDRQPPGETWPRIEAAIASGDLGAPTERMRVGRRQVWAWTLLGAAAAMLLAVWTARTGYFTSSKTAETSESPTAQSIEAELALASEHYQKAITGLEQIAASGEGSLDPEMAAALQRNLAVVDQAISESRAALKAQPDSEPAQQSLLENFKAKVSLLQDTIALINEFRKGNDAGAARIVSGLKKGA
jgi:anti-sigma factor RsiW